MCVTFARTLFSQDASFKLNGKVIDNTTKLTLSSVSVQINGTLKGTTTDSNGVFDLTIQEKGALLTFSMLGYENKIIKVNSSSSDTLIVELSEIAQILSEITISSSPIENIIKSKGNNVLDYDFYGDNILLITYKNHLSKSKLILLDHSLDTLSKIDIPEEPTGLFKDCLGYDHIVCESSIYQIDNDSSGLKLLPAEPIQSFEKILYPCVAEDSLNLYFSQKYGSVPVGGTNFHSFNSANNIINYTCINKFTKKKSNLASIADEEMVKKRQEEVEYEQRKLAAGMYTHGSPEQDRLFFETVMISDVYAPLYKINNSIYIFDYVNSHILRYSSEGKLTQEIDINFHHEKHWKHQMFIDEKSGKAFAMFDGGGITELKEINLNNGKIDNSYKIPFVFVKDIKVRDNYIYFIYKTNDYNSSKCLSRLRIG